MRRRDFLTMVAGAAVAPWTARAQGLVQAPAKRARIGLLDDAPYWREPFVEGLKELGYRAPDNIEFLVPAGDPDLDLPSQAAELVACKVDVIVTGGSVGALAAKRATATIPIVALAMGDPVRSGLVSNLAHPGGNLTGAANLNPEVMSKRVQLLRELLPAVKRVAFLYDPENVSNLVARADFEQAGAAFGIAVEPLEATTVDQLTAALNGLRGRGADALMTAGSAVSRREAVRLAGLAAEARIPAMYVSREGVIAGGLISYGASFIDLFRRGATYVDSILKGANPGDLPVQAATKFDLAINLKAARALGLAVPSSLLVQADEVIE